MNSGGAGVLMDIYALAPERSAEAVDRFLTRFLPNRERADADYTVMVGDDEPAAVLNTLEELAGFCQAEPQADARAYWTSQAPGDPHSAHVFFLPDGGWCSDCRWLPGIRRCGIDGFPSYGCSPGRSMGTGPASARPRAPSPSSSRWPKGTPNKALQP